MLLLSRTLSGTGFDRNRHKDGKESLISRYATVSLPPSVLFPYSNGNSRSRRPTTSCIYPGGSKINVPKGILSQGTGLLEGDWIA